MVKSIQYALPLCIRQSSDATLASSISNGQGTQNCITTKKPDTEKARKAKGFQQN